MGNVVVGLPAVVQVGGGGPVSSLSTRIGEHIYWCWGKTPCTVGSSSFIGSQVNVDTLAWTLGVMAFIVALAAVVRRGLSAERPGSVQNVLEAIFEFVNGFVADSLGTERARAIGPLAVALFLFILVANYVDLIPWPRADAPTSDVNTTAGLALMVFVLVHVLGIRQHGLRGYIRHVFATPMLAPITVIEEIAKPMTLALRLFGNIFAGAVLIIVFGVLLSHLLVVATLPIPYVFALGLGLFVGAIQAFIFAVLTVAYIGIATSSEAH